MQEEYIVLKGRKGGFEIILSQRATFFMIREALIEKLNMNKRFFEGSNTKVRIIGKKLSLAQQREIKTMLENAYGMNDVEFYKDAPPEDVKTDAEVEISSAVASGFIRKTIRSGQTIESEGDIVILGDVDTGAQLIAKGSICVMGELKGSAHAGCKGNEDSVVSALVLTPTQLKIADLSLLSTEGQEYQPLYPEIARAEKGAIVIEPLYIPQDARKRKRRIINR